MPFHNKIPTDNTYVFLIIFYVKTQTMLFKFRAHNSHYAHNFVTFRQLKAFIYPVITM